MNSGKTAICFMNKDMVGGKMRIRTIDGGMYGSNMDRRTEKSD